MWAKRFPVPQFDRHSLKNLTWTSPTLHSELQADRAFGCTEMSGNESFFTKFGFQGEHLAVIGCRLPDTAVHMSGNSFAWPIQRAVVTDSLDAAHCTILADWKTPRPMNTRFGPDDGLEISANEVYVLIGHQIADHWIANRIILDNEWNPSEGEGFRILSSSESDINDFHDAVVYMKWQS